MTDQPLPARLRDLAKRMRMVPPQVDWDDIPPLREAAAALEDAQRELAEWDEGMAQRDEQRNALRAAEQRADAAEKALRSLAEHHEQCCVAGPYDPENDAPQCPEYLRARELISDGAIGSYKSPLPSGGEPTPCDDCVSNATQPFSRPHLHDEKENV